MKTHNHTVHKVVGIIALTMTCYLFDTVTLNAQVKFVNEFLNIGVGARAHGMAGAVVASVSDGSAGYWNTAGLSEVNVPLEVNVMHAEWFGGIANYDFINITKQINAKKGTTLGFSLIRMGVDNIPNTLNLIGPDGSVDYDKITNFSASDIAFLGSYATKLQRVDGLSVGGNVKIIRRTIGSFGGAWGFGADASLKYKPNSNLSFGLSLRDITTTFNAWSFDFNEDEKETFIQTGNEIPISSVESTLPRAIGGVSYLRYWGNVGLLGEFDINISSDGRASGIFSGKNLAFDPSVGIEVSYLQKVFIRGGISNIQRSINEQVEEAVDFQPNVGVGIKLGNLSVDYALANVGNVSGLLASHIFSLKIGFKPKEAPSL